MRRTLLSIALSAGLAAPVGAADLVLGAESNVWFDDNVFGSSSGETSDYSWSVAPTIDLSERWSTLDGRVWFRPAYELYVQEDRLSGFSYDGAAQLEWRPTARTTFALTDSAQRYRTLRGFAPGQGAQPPVLAGRERFTRNVAQLTLNHRLSELGTLRASAGHTLWEFERPDRPDQTSTSASLQYFRAVTPFLRLGAQASFARQGFEFDGSESETDYWNASGTLSFAPADTLSIEASVGPTWIRRPASRLAISGFTRRDLTRFSGQTPLVGVVGTCPLLASGQPYDGAGCQFQAFPFASLLLLDDPIGLIGPRATSGSDDWTYFANASVVKQWTRVSVSLSYERDQGESAAISSSSVADTVEASVTIELVERFSITATTSWQNREDTQQLGAGRYVTVLGTLPAVNVLVPVGVAAAPVVSRKAGIRSLSASLGGNFALDEHLVLRGVIGWTDQNAELGSGFGSLSRLYVTFGLDYEFPPIRW